METTPPLPPPKRAGCLVQAGRVLLGLLLLLVVLAILGTLYESNARAQALASVAPPGQVVDVGGHRLHIFCLGEKSADQPTVILEAGAGGWSAHWYAFQREVATLARVCAYDRAGFGWSEAGALPRDGQRIAEELHTLLANAGEQPPYVLVGASRGGQYARIYRDAYPDEVAGLLLVDAEPEDFRSQTEVGQNVASQNQAVFSVVGTLTRLGVLRLLGGDPASAPEIPCLPFLVKTLPPEAHAAYLAVEGQPKCFDALLTEEAATEQREAQVRQTQPLGDLPLVVLTHGLTAPAAGGASPEQAAQAEEVWQTLQKQLATLSSLGELVQASESGHNIALDQPELVLDAIRGMLAQ
ncbi:MAG: alpha/beta hydrolase [Ardenticatenales bacterium]|nr:alpha/beta hydrolase [Ardenticatenales bacterium]